MRVAGSAVDLGLHRSDWLAVISNPVSLNGDISDRWLGYEETVGTAELTLGIGSVDSAGGTTPIISSKLPTFILCRVEHRDFYADVGAVAAEDHRRRSVVARATAVILAALLGFNHPMGLFDGYRVARSLGRIHSVGRALFSPVHSIGDGCQSRRCPTERFRIDVQCWHPHLFRLVADSSGTVQPLSMVLDELHG